MSTRLASDSEALQFRVSQLAADNNGMKSQLRSERAVLDKYERALVSGVRGSGGSHYALSEGEFSEGEAKQPRPATNSEASMGERKGGRPAPLEFGDATHAATAPETPQVIRSLKSQVADVKSHVADELQAASQHSEEQFAQLLKQAQDQRQVNEQQKLEFDRTIAKMAADFDARLRTENESARTDASQDIRSQVKQLEDKSDSERRRMLHTEEQRERAHAAELQQLRDQLEDEKRQTEQRFKHELDEIKRKLDLERDRERSEAQLVHAQHEAERVFFDTLEHPDGERRGA